MAEIKLKCPLCEEVIAVDDSLLGTTIHCPKCAGAVNLPTRPKPEVASPPPPPPPPPQEASFVFDEPRAAQGVATPEEETEVFNYTPRLLSYLGEIVWRLVWVVFGIVVYEYLAGITSLADIKWLGSLSEQLGKYTLSPYFSYIGLVIVFFGLLGLVRVWVESTFNRYRLTTQRLFLRTGFITRRSEEIELFRVKDVSVRQGLLNRLVGVGIVTVLSSDDTTPYMVLRGVPGPDKVKEQIRQGSKAARKREGMRAAEFIQS